MRGLHVDETDAGGGSGFGSAMLPVEVPISAAANTGVSGAPAWGRGFFLWVQEEHSRNLGSRRRRPSPADPGNETRVK